MVTLNHPRNMVDLAYAQNPNQVAEYRSRGYRPLDEWRAMPDELRQMRQRLDDQINLIQSLRRQLGEV